MLSLCCGGSIEDGRGSIEDGRGSIVVIVVIVSIEDGRGSIGNERDLIENESSFIENQRDCLRMKLCLKMKEI